jgi:uncharacterized Tic20 family protein
MTADQSHLAAPLTADEERRWTMLAHLSGLLSFVGPLIVWLVFRDRSDAVDRESREALNAQITYAAAALALYVVGGVLAIVLVGFVFITAAAIVQVGALILAIVGAVRTNASGGYRYPVSVRLVK